ncbi:MAG TPA: LysE family transporter [Bacteroidia bacterium]|nr:LysE family transporter [Bacteroidia bacterium]
MTTFSAIGQGMLFGLALCFTLSPSFFTLIQTTLKNGHAAGISVATGIFFADLCYLLLAYFGVSEWVMDERYAIAITVLGGGLLIGYGIVQILKKPVVSNENEESDSPAGKKAGIGANILKGFLMSLLNPFVFFLWIGALSLATSRFDHDAGKMISFFIATLCTVFGTDVLKSMAAHRIKSFLNEKMIHKVNMFAGIIFVIAGIVMFVRMIVEKPWLG